MYTPTEHELRHLSSDYDPVQAHEYYLRTRQLRGRHRGSTQPPSSGRRPSAQDSRTGHTRAEIHQNARARQRQELAERIRSLQSKLNRLEAKIREMEHKEASEDRKGKAKKERAAKEKDKPKSAAEKTKAARENEKYRKAHKQELKNKSKKDSSKSGGGSSSKGKESGSKSETLSNLKALATRVRGQIAVAKQKLAAL